MIRLQLVGGIITLFLLVGCGGENHNQSDSQTMDHGEHTEHAEMDMGSQEPTDESIYNTSSVWLNRHGEELQLKQLQGKYQVVAMLYTHCEYACPRIMADMKRIREQIPVEKLDETNFVIVSIDPERDTPKRFREFARENDLSDEQWTLLHGDQGDVLELAALLGVKYKRISKTDFSHSNMITLLNKKGEVVYQRKKLTDKPEQFVNYITQTNQ